MFRDIRFGLKVLWKDRGYSTTAMLTFAICIGANAAIFTIVNSVLLKTLPLPDSNRILLMSNQYPQSGGGAANSMFSAAPDYYDRLGDMKVFEEQAMYNPANWAFDIDGAPELIRGMNATPSLFRLLRVAPAQGRIFDESEGAIGSHQKIILSYGLARQLYGDNPVPLGQPIRLAGIPYTLVGVMPRNFEFADPLARFWVPLAFSQQQKSDDARHSNNWMNIGRLKPGATIEQAQEQINALNVANLDRFPQNKQVLLNAGFYTRVERLQDALVRNIRGTLYLLWGGAAFVLLIAAGNIANLALARSIVRGKELITRLALGAGRALLVRQLIVETLLITVAGGVVGIVVGLGILQALVTIGLERLPRAGEIRMDLNVVATALSVSIVAGVLIGLLPARHLFKINLSRVLHEQGRTGTIGHQARALRRILVVAQVAIAFVLLLGSALLLASFRNLLAADHGFNAERVITAGMGIPGIRYPTENDARAFTNRALQAVRNVPGVVKAGGTTLIPLGGNNSNSVILAEGYSMKPGEALISPSQAMITPGYFEAMSTPLVRGRYFDEHDNEKTTGVVIIDEVLAKRFWPSVDPLGKRTRKTAMLLALFFGAVSLVLSAVGIYGVLAYLVTQRAREIGIRIALGSSTRGIFMLVMRECAWVVGVGLLLGLSATVPLRSVLQRQIYGLSAMDPLLITMIVVVLATIALIACALPARRAARVDPVVVLNQP
jgi:predicted permease